MLAVRGFRILRDGGGSGQHGGRIRAGGDIRIEAAADERWTEIAHTAAVGGEDGFAPVQRDAIAFPAGAQISRRLGEFQRWRQRRSGLGATGKKKAERDRRDKPSRIWRHAERVKIICFKEGPCHLSLGLWDCTRARAAVKTRWA